MDHEIETIRRLCAERPDAAYPEMRYGRGGKSDRHPDTAERDRQGNRTVCKVMPGSGNQYDIARGACVDFFSYCKLHYGDTPREAIARMKSRLGLTTAAAPPIARPPKAESRKEDEPKPAYTPAQVRASLPRLDGTTDDFRKGRLSNFHRWALGTAFMLGGDMRRALTLYLVGQSPDAGKTVFWYLDGQRRVWVRKEMAYRPDGHRDKNGRWSVMARGPVSRCLFGEHLLPLMPGRAVCAVESEKTAVCMAALNCAPQGEERGAVWVATGGGANLRRLAECEHLAGRRVYLCPDNDPEQAPKWAALAAEKGWCADRSLYEGLPPKGDLADWFQNLRDRAAATEAGQYASRLARGNPQFYECAVALRLTPDDPRLQY